LRGGTDGPVISHGRLAPLFFLKNSEKSWINAFPRPERYFFPREAITPG
jgi:hypothetical protein